MLSEKYAQRAKLAAEKAKPIRNIDKPRVASPTLVSCDVPEAGVDVCAGREWLLTNSMGGYSSSTVLGLNVRRYHGLLVPSYGGLVRRLLLHGFEEALETSEGVLRLSCVDAGGSSGEGFKLLKSFELHPTAVCFGYDSGPVTVYKRVSMLSEENAVLVSYDVGNDGDSDVTFSVRPLLNSRLHSSLSTGGNFSYSVIPVGGSGVAFRTAEDYLFLYCDCGGYSPEAPKIRENVFYRAEKSSESCLEAGSFTVKVGSRSQRTVNFSAVGYPTEGAAGPVMKRILDVGFKNLAGSCRNVLMGSPMMCLLSMADSFVVDFRHKRAVVAGYPHYGFRSRDALISMPGLMLINGRLGDARSLLECLLNNVKAGRVPSEFVGGDPVYGNLDSSLWCVDRLREYVRYAGFEEGKAFLHTYWWTVKDIMLNFANLERDGMLAAEADSWTGVRKSPVELQGLWYNALKTVEYLSGRFGYEMPDLRLDGLLERFEENFLEKYWRDHYLLDSVGCDDFRPNQILMLSMEYCPLKSEYAVRILDQAEIALLTSYGLRSLEQQSPKYDSEGFRNPYDGAVFPWLFGPYVRAYLRFMGDSSRTAFKKMLDDFFSLVIWEDGIGSVSEYYAGAKKFVGGGCPFYALSVAEPLRAYFEDVMGRKPALP
ncbi:MAG: amylo-alpha-1,6-glucosidase [Candidatus Altiarchaeota archaeon]